MQAQYDSVTVLLSYVVAVVASYVALDMASRVSATKGTSSSNYWLIGGAGIAQVVRQRRQVHQSR